MGRKKTEVGEGEITIDNFRERICSELNKRFESNIAISGTDILNEEIKIIPWCRSLNGILGGGVPQGTWLSVAGKPKTGKTYSLLQLAASAQAHGMFCYIMIPEARLKKMNLSGTHGLLTDPDHMMIIRSTENKILTMQDYLNAAEIILKTHPRCFLLIDSISALIDEKEYESGLGTQTRGGGNKVITQFINLVCQTVPAMKSIVAGVVHIIANTSGYGSPVMEKSANRWKYQADIGLNIKSYKEWTVGSGAAEKTIGHVVNFECKSNALTSPYGTCDTYLRFGHGIDDIYETLMAAESVGMINKNGAWYELSFVEQQPELLAKLGSVPKLQGGENLWEYLKDNIEVYQSLEKLLV